MLIVVVVSITGLFYGVRLLAPRPTPQPGGLGTGYRLVPPLRAAQFG